MAPHRQSLLLPNMAAAPTLGPCHSHHSGLQPSVLTVHTVLCTQPMSAVTVSIEIPERIGFALALALRP